MRNYDEPIEINQNPNRPFRILIIGGSVSGKTNVLLNLIKQQPDVEKIYYNSKIHLNQSINCL